MNNLLCSQSLISMVELVIISYHCRFYLCSQLTGTTVAITITGTTIITIIPIVKALRLCLAQWSATNAPHQQFELFRKILILIFDCGWKATFLKISHALSPNISGISLYAKYLTLVLERKKLYNFFNLCNKA